MQLKLIDPNSYKTTQWSAGTTTELYILPEGADYASRQFDLRVSSATVDAPESTFTALPGFKRILTPLQEPLRIFHPDRPEEVLLQPYDLHAFSGGERTRSQGQGRDFNVIYRPDWQVEARSLGPEDGQVTLSEPALYLIFSAQAQSVALYPEGQAPENLDFPSLGLAQLEVLPAASPLSLKASQSQLILIQISR